MMGLGAAACSRGIYYVICEAAIYGIVSLVLSDRGRKPNLDLYVTEDGAWRDAT